MQNEVYQKLNEGLGGAYERVAYSNVIKQVADDFNCKSILELNATYIAGIPGFNSCILAQAGYDVTVAVLPRDYEDAKHVWELTGLKANIVKIEDDLNTQFEDDQFDMVYNHLAFDQCKNPSPLVIEMYRLSKKVVMTLTLNPFNYGWWLHWLNHKIVGEKWGHGYPSRATIGAQKKVMGWCGLDVVQTGFCDAPFWMDTVDAHLGGSMTYMDNMPESVRNNWVWTSINPECQKHWLTRFLWELEANMPKWFGTLAAHHLYCVGVK